MPTEQLDDRELDEMLRDLLPPLSPQSTAWEQERRAELLTFIESGDVRARTSAPAGPEPVEVRADRRSARPQPLSPRPWVLAAAATLILVLGGALILLPRLRSTEDPVAGPTATLIEPGGELGAAWPDAFPVLPDPVGDDAVGSYSQVAVSTPITSAIVGRVGDDTVSDIVRLQVVGEFDDIERQVSSAGSVTVAGAVYELIDEVGSPSVTTALRRGDLDVLITAVDPVGFIEAGGGDAIEAARIGDESTIEFDIGALPAGYEVVIAPTPLQPGEVAAMLTVPPAGNGTLVIVEASNLLVSSQDFDDWQRVDVNGAVGWGRAGTGNPVTWPVSDTTWATVFGSESVDAAVDLARSLSFVDEATWRDRYGVDAPIFDVDSLPDGDLEPDMPDMEDALPAEADTVAVSAEPERVSYIELLQWIGRYTIPLDLERTVLGSIGSSQIVLEANVDGICVEIVGSGSGCQEVERGTPDGVFSSYPDVDASVVSGVRRIYWLAPPDVELDLMYLGEPLCDLGRMPITPGDDAAVWACEETIRPRTDIVLVASRGDESFAARVEDDTLRLWTTSAEFEAEVLADRGVPPTATPTD